MKQVAETNPATCKTYIDENSFYLNKPTDISQTLFRDKDIQNTETTEKP